MGFSSDLRELLKTDSDIIFLDQVIFYGNQRVKIIYTDNVRCIRLIQKILCLAEQCNKRIDNSIYLVDDLRTVLLIH